MHEEQEAEGEAVAWCHLAETVGGGCHKCARGGVGVLSPALSADGQPERGSVL